MFQKFYSKMLAKRLVQHMSASDDAEASMISKLKVAIGYLPFGCSLTPCLLSLVLLPSVSHSFLPASPLVFPNLSSSPPLWLILLSPPTVAQISNCPPAISPIFTHSSMLSQCFGGNYSKHAALSTHPNSRGCSKILELARTSMRSSVSGVGSHRRRKWLA